VFDLVPERRLEAAKAVLGTLSPASAIQLIKANDQGQRPRVSHFHQLSGTNPV
jgi:hypothetical protein